MFIRQDINELQKKLEEFKSQSVKIELNTNLSKTTTLTTVGNIIMRLGNLDIQNVREYVYLGHNIKLGMGNRNAEINRRGTLPVMTEWTL